MKEQLKQFCLLACVRETDANFSPFSPINALVEKWRLVNRKRFALSSLKRQSVITVQRAFRIKFGCQLPNDNNILRWYHQFETTGCLCKGKRTGRPRL
ncbi:DUF4817 domain-containing protein [Trichonephila clavipes]|nr:DUF4817 domain-containing protein [Trichonephila clavipes]